MRILNLCVVIVVFFSLGILEPARAEEYSLGDLYRIALDRSEEVKIAKENVTYSVQEKNRARAILLPRLSAFASYQKYSDEKYSVTEYTIPPNIPFTTEFLLQPKTAEIWGLKAEQAFSLSLREITAFRMARNGIRKSTYDLSALQETYLLEVAGAYYRVLMAKRGVDIAQSNLERVSKYRDAALARQKVGEITKTVLLRAESELSGAKSDLIKVQNALALARASLARIAGIDESFTLREEQPPKEQEATLPELKDTAYSQRPELKSLEYQVKMSKQEVSYAWGAFWPYLCISGAFQRSENDPDSDSLDLDTTYGALTVNFPFFEGGLRWAEVQQAKVRQRQAVLQYDNEKKAVGLDVERAYLDLMTRKGTLTFLNDQLAFAQDNYRGVSRQFSLGQASSIDVIDANNLLVSSERQLAEALYSYQLAILALEKATGTFMEKVQGLGGEQ